MTTTLGKYELIEELGRGGFGTVYRARDTILDVERAVKVLHPALVTAPEFIERFRREGRLSARLEHPNIVPVYELGEVDGRYFLAMKYLSGGSLKDVLTEKGRLSFDEALEITRQIAEALTYAYNQPGKLIHRDLKPGNILFETLPNGESKAVVRLSDFGFAKALADAGTSSSSSASGGMLGTPAYMAPEVWRGQSASPAADQYALACVFYEMLTGETLFAGDTPPEIMTKHVLDGPQFPALWPQDVPAGVSNALKRALATDPSGRYQSMNNFRDACLELFMESEYLKRAGENLIQVEFDTKREPEHTEEQITVAPWHEQLLIETPEESNCSLDNAKTDKTASQMQQGHLTDRKNYLMGWSNLAWYIIGGAIGGAIGEARGQPINWPIIGAMIAIILYKQHIFLNPLANIWFISGWVIIFVFFWDFFFGGLILAVLISFAIGWVAMGVVLNKKGAFPSRPSSIWLVLGWATAFFVGWLSTLGTTFAIGWAIGGAIGGLVTIWQIREGQKDRAQKHGQIP